MDKIEEANEGKILVTKTTKFQWCCNDVPMLLLASSPFMAREGRTARERASGGRTREVREGGFSRLPQMETFDRRLTPFTLGLCRTNHNRPLCSNLYLVLRAKGKALGTRLSVSVTSRNAPPHNVTTLTLLKWLWGRQGGRLKTNLTL